jgi:flagellar basal body rod protein FlgG
MYTELYTTVSGMTARQLQMDHIANNLANVDTVGFKTVQILLEEKPLETPTGIVRVPSHVIPTFQWTDFAPGHIKSSGNPLDVAIEGDGFFVVETPEGIRLTRDGRFSRDKDGSLMLRGMPVQGTQGEIRLPEEPVQIKQDGRILRGRAEIAQLRVVTVPRLQELEKQDEGLYRVPEDQTVEDLSDARVLQGHLEMSNANGIRLMVQMLETVRSFELHQKMLQTVDELTEKSVSTLARTT